MTAKPARPSARQRTVSHMHRLLAAATVVTVASSASCGKERKGGTESKGCGGSKTDPATDGGGETTAQVDADLGYAVVDPMPTPAYCPGVGKLISAKAKMVEEAGVLHVVITFSPIKSRPDFKYVSDSNATAWNGTAITTKHGPDGTVVVTVRLDAMNNGSSPVVGPDGTRAALHVSLHSTCNAGPQQISGVITWPKGQRVTATTTPLVVIQEY